MAIPLTPTKQNPPFVRPRLLVKKSVYFIGVCSLLSRLAFCADGIDPEAAIKKFTIPENFEVKVWAAEPLLENPVSFSFDEQGRAYVAETHRFNNSVFDITQNTNWLRDDLSFETVGQRAEFLKKTFGTNVNNLTRFSERLQMLSDHNRDGRADDGHTVAENFREVESGLAAGVLARGTNLWFACIPDLWRYLDSNGDGIPDQAHKLHTGFGVHIGVTGHDLHGLTMGPDGRLYFSMADRGFNVEADGRHLESPHTGGVLRCEPDGSHLEIFAVGMRNPQELAFDDLGNLFAGDNDTSGPDNCRLLYVVADGDYGWRCSYQHMNGFGPWVQENLWNGVQDGMLPHSGNPAQGPSGFAFYPGTGLPQEYDHHFFICDFPGGIWSFETAPKGAGFELTNHNKFIWNLWPTDVEFGPDEGIYFSDWVGGWTLPDKGRIYHARAKSGVRASGTKELLAADFTARSEADLIWLISSADYRIRQKSQFELARREAVPALMKVAGEGTGRARIHALWALGQIARHDHADAKVSWTSIAGLLHDSDAEIRAQVARIAGDAHFAKAEPNLIPLLKDDSARVRFFAAETLEQLGDADALPALIEMGRANANDPFLLHPVIVGTAKLASKEYLQKLAADSDLAVRRIALLAMRRNGDPRVAEFLRDEKLVVEAARAINDEPIPAGFSALAAIANRPDLPKPATLRALNANFRLGTSQAAQRLEVFARNEKAPADLRAQALDMLGDWAAPDAVDRVVGLWRPLAERDPSPAREQIERCFEKIASENSEPIQLALLNSIQRLNARVPSAALLGLFDDAAKSSKVRIQALETLVSLKAPESAQALVNALDSKAEEIRLLACHLAASTKSDGANRKLIALCESDSSVSVRQAALRSLRGIDTPELRSMLGRLADGFAAGSSPDSLRLETISALESIGDPALKSKLSDLQQNASRALLAGGNAEEGSKIFHDRPDVSCMRCHALNGNGGTVGPDLAHIGAKKSREYLLEAVETPNRTIAEGFEQVVLRLKDGTSPAGLVKSESATELVLDSPEDGVLHIAKSDIESRIRNLSAMPEGFDKMLSPYELRDLIEYLASLK
jgi:quinoprotein glucose dehydrogenase